MQRGNDIHQGHKTSTQPTTARSAEENANASHRADAGGPVQCGQPAASPPPGPGGETLAPGPPGEGAQLKHNTEAHKLMLPISLHIRLHVAFQSLLNYEFGSLSA